MVHLLHHLNGADAPAYKYLADGLQASQKYGNTTTILVFYTLDSKYSYRSSEAANDAINVPCTTAATSAHVLIGF